MKRLDLHIAAGFIIEKYGSPDRVSASTRFKVNGKRRRLLCAKPLKAGFFKNTPGPLCIRVCGLVLKFQQQRIADYNFTFWFF